MNLKQKKNYIFIITVLVLGLFIGLFNWFTDSYHLLHKKDNYINVFDKPDKLIPLYIQNYANIKNENLIIGFSDAQTTFGIHNFYNALFFNNTNCEFIYNCLKEYLSLHKETKKVIFVVSYNIFLNPLDDNHNNNFKRNKIKDLLYLLYSKDVTLSNIRFVFNNIDSFFYNNSSKVTAADYDQMKGYIVYYPHFLTDFDYKINNFEKIKKNGYVTTNS